MNLTKPILWLVILVLLLAAVIALSGNSATQELQQVSTTPTQTQNGVRIPPQQPAPTAADTVTAQQGNTFALLVSYVNSGFEPQSATVHVGDTVRFTNNSTGQLWVAATGDQLYPGLVNGCGSSALDSCMPLSPGQFWEFTFTQKGTWQFDNNLDKSNSGTVIVK